VRGRVIRLERELQSELQLPHAGSGPRRGVGFDVGDATVAGAINAGTGSLLIGQEAEHRVIEQVEGIHAELSFYPFSDGKVLHDRGVRLERAWSAEAVEAYITERPASWNCEPWAAGPSQGAGVQPRTKPGCGVCHRWYWRKKGLLMRDGIKRARTDVKATVLVGTAQTHIVGLTTVREAWRPGQAPAPVAGPRDLPAAENRILTPACISCKSLAFAEGQFIHHVGYPDLIADLLIGPVRIRMAVGIVRAVVFVRVGERVVGKHLQPVGEPLVQLHLQRVVDAAGVIAVVIAFVGGAAL
jgi:hypothetical protein